MTSGGLAIAQFAAALPAAAALTVVALLAVAVTDVYEIIADVALTAGYEKFAAASAHTSVFIAGPATFAARAVQTVTVAGCLNFAVGNRSLPALGLFHFVNLMSLCLLVEDCN